MRKTATVLVVLAVMALAVTAAPTLGEETPVEQEEPRPCVTFKLTPPGVYVDPTCIDHVIPPPTE